MKKLLTRQCISCRVQATRENFFRILQKNDPSSSIHEAVLNPSKREFGRSLYICKNQSCIKTAVKKKKLEKLLKVSKASLNRLIEKLEGEVNKKTIVT